MGERRERDNTTEANRAMNREFGKDDPGPDTEPTRAGTGDRAPADTSEDGIKGDAAGKANEAARVRKPFP